MNKRVKELWTDALRSGEYTQGDGVLRTTEDEYCCLGVLCDIYHKETGKGGWKLCAPKNNFQCEVFVFTGKDLDETPEHVDPDKWQYLPASVVKWAGLEAKDPVVYVLDDYGKSAETLSTLNDDGACFAEIAQAIEKSL